VTHATSAQMTKAILLTRSESVQSTVSQFGR